MDKKAAKNERVSFYICPDINNHPVYLSYYKILSFYYKLSFEGHLFETTCTRD